MKTPNAQRGAGLIEVLVTVLILATSLLAMGALQSRSLEFNYGAFLRSQANVMAYDILDRIRVNRREVGSYSLDMSDDAPTGNSLAEEDISGWLNSVEANLPGGDAAIDCDAATNVCSVEIQWIDDDRRGEEISEENAQEKTSFFYATQI